MTARFDPFAAPGPRWFAIEARRPFLEDLAAGVLEWARGLEPEALADSVVLLPNRRAARAFVDALAKQAEGRTLLLPQVRPLGDLEEDEPPFSPGDLGLDLPPAIEPLARRFELARLVSRLKPELSPHGALDVGQALGRFLASCQLEEIGDLSGLGGLVEGELARHWALSAEFLSAAAEAWPRRLAELGLVDPAWRRARLLRLLAERWTDRPPVRPVIAAGSTGSAPAAADVLAAVAAAPLGCVVLPGLDFELASHVWDTLGDNEQHPQNALWRLLQRHGVAREGVGRWPAPPAEPRAVARQRLIHEALRPADATGDWRGVIRALRADAFRLRSADPIAQGLEGLSVVVARAEEETAATLALLMRETLETPGRSCALVTPDIALGRRVAARLERWGVVADESAGRALSSLPAGSLIDLCARWTEAPLDPHALLGLLKHPLVRLDAGEADPRDAVRALERRALRGPRQRDWARLRRRLLKALEPREDGRVSEGARRDVDAAGPLLDRLEALSQQAVAPFAPAATLDEAARGLVRLVEALAGQDVWAGRDGEAAAALMDALIAGGRALGPVDWSQMRDVVSRLLADETVRTGGATHPRLRILGPIEARLVRADRMILAGLEEGVWPAAAATDPFLSRPMRERLGLPPPERRLGQTAQDFVQAACADEVILVHSERRGGQPAVKSRWLWRLEMLTRGANAAGTPVALPHDRAPLDRARALDAPAKDRPDYARRPAPTPPVARRPRELPVTGVERWVRDPYAVYARYILGLSRMERPGEAGDALVRGTAIHAALQRFGEDWPEALPEACAPAIEDLLIRALDEAGFDEAAMARERVLARNCASWLAGFEVDRRLRAERRLIEARGRTVLPGPYGPFVLTARADRIDIGPGGAAVIDFKTGSVPSAKQVREHFAPQLTLTAAILADGGFPEAGPVEATELLYVKIIGRTPPGEIVDVSALGRNNTLTAAQMAEAARDGLIRRIAEFDREETAYPSWAAPQFMGTFGGNYDHLARVWEWHVVGAEEAEAE